MITPWVVLGIFIGGVLLAIIQARSIAHEYQKLLDRIKELEHDLGILGIAK